MAEVASPGVSSKRFALGSAAAFCVYSFGIGLAFFSQLLLARLLGADTFGVYAYVLAWMSVLAYLATFGFEVALLRFVSVYTLENSWALLAGIIRYTERRAAAFSAVLMALGLGAVFVFGSGLSPELRTTFLFGFILVPTWAFTWIRCSIVRAFGGVISSLVPLRIVWESVLMVFVAIAALGLHWKLGAPTVMAVTAFGSVLALVLASAAMRVLRPVEINNVAPKYETQIWRKAALPLLVVAVAEALLNKMGVLILGGVGETTSAGIFALVFNMAFLVVIPRLAIDTIFAPAMARLHSQNKTSELKALTTRAGLMSLGVAIFIAVVIGVLAEPVLAWFGPEFSRGVLPLRILLIGQLVGAGAGSQLKILAMTANERAAANILVLSVSVGAVSSTVLIFLFGLTGAAIATCGTLVFWNVAMAVFIWRHLLLPPGALGAIAFLQPIRRAGSDGLAGTSDTSDTHDTLVQTSIQERE